MGPANLLECNIEPEKHSTYALRHIADAEYHNISVLSQHRRWKLSILETKLYVRSYHDFLVGGSDLVTINLAEATTVYAFKVNAGTNAR